MSAAEKFMFELSFDEELAPEEEPAEDELAAEEEEPEEVVPTFSQEEVEQARQQGYEEGKQEGLAATTETLTRQANETLAGIDEKLAAAMEDQQAVNGELSRAAISVAVGICRKMLPALAEKHAFDEVESVVESVFSRILEEPTATFTVHPDLVEKIGERVNELSAQKAYQGRIVVQSQDGVEPGDCRVEWPNGGGERDTRALWREIDAIVDQNLGNHPTMWERPETLEDDSPAPAAEDSPPVEATEQSETDERD